VSEQNYSLQQSGGWIDKLALKKRLTMLQTFMKEFPSATLEHILDAGVTADKSALSSNYLEKFFPEKNKITALSNQEASFLEQEYPGVRFRHGDVRHLPFQDKEMDVVFSSAVIEHIGNDENQQRMIAECVRVAKKGVFITTPNRWHPIEVHTLLPFIHWLPKKLHRKLLKFFGYLFYSQEENLNLVDKKKLKTFCQKLGIQNFTIHYIKTWGIMSNLMLVIKL